MYDDDLQHGGGTLAEQTCLYPAALSTAHCAIFFHNAAELIERRNQDNDEEDDEDDDDDNDDNDDDDDIDDIDDMHYTQSLTYLFS